MYKIVVEFDSPSFSHSDILETIVRDRPLERELLTFARVAVKDTTLKYLLNDVENDIIPFNKVFSNVDGEAVINLSRGEYAHEEYIKIFVSKYETPNRYTGLPEISLNVVEGLISENESDRKFMIEYISRIAKELSESHPYTLNIFGQAFTPSNVYTAIMLLGGLSAVRKVNSDSNYKHTALLTAYNHFWIEGRK